MPAAEPPRRNNAGTIAAHPTPTSANPTSAGAGERVVIARSVPAHVIAPLRCASPLIPQRSVRRSPTRRARPIAAAYATTAPAATAELAPAGPLRKTALQFIAADSTKNAKNIIAAGSASGPRGSAKRGASACTAVPDRRRGANTATTRASSAAAAGSCRRTPMPAAAEKAVNADPPRRPKLHAACNGESSGLPMRPSRWTPCALIATSVIPSPAPRTSAIATSGPSDGMNAAAASAAQAAARPSAAGPRLPKRELSHPASGSDNVAASVTAKMTMPRRPLSRESRCLRAGNRATQTPSIAPSTTKPATRARCARCVSTAAR